MKKMTIKHIILLILVLLLSLGTVACSSGKSAPASKEAAYPAKQIELVVPYTAGGGTDMVARATADVLSKKWNVPIIVTNKPGGATVPGVNYALKEAKADGYTVLMDAHTSSSMMVGAFKNPPITLADRKFVGRIILDPFAFAVKADAPWKDLKEFSNWAKSNPEKLMYGTVGPSGPSRYVVSEWLSTIGVDPAKAKMVVTDGGSDSLTKLAGGHINLAVHTVAESYALAEAGKIKILGVLSDKRSPYMPNVPTVKEQGVMDQVNAKYWVGISLPTGAPDTIVKKWEAALADLSKDPDFQAKIKNQHMTVDVLNSADTTAFIKKEAEFYTDMATKLGMRK